ncbi:MAG: phosphodiester glycosidase family protein [Lachnospiraceae bacterium]|nr:phosphodiester glycosidase family protein [Lachnospiraceae bacterium]
MNKRKSGKPETNNTSVFFRKRFARRWYAISSVLILLWSIWTLLDAFIIPRDIIAAADIVEETSPKGSTSGETKEPSALSETDKEEEERIRLLTDPVITDTTYNNGEVSIEIRYMRTLNTDVYVADITMSDPSYLKTALAEGSFGRNLTDLTSNMAQENSAILAINGDYYGFRDTGYVIRNGYLYRSVPSKDQQQEDLVFYEDCSVVIVREADVTAEELWDAGAEDVFSFGPGLVIDGEISVEKGEEVKRAQVTNPRTAFGVISPLHFLFVVSDGRTDENVGLSLLELAGLMKDLGCVTAYNLDGGGSSTMWFNGKVLNKPTTFGDIIAERDISDIIYIKK